MHSSQPAAVHRVGSVALTGLKENDIVVTHQYSLFKCPDNATEPDIPICWYIHLDIFHTFLEISIFEKEYPKYLGSPFPGNWGGILASKDKICSSFEKFILVTSQ